MVSEVRLTVQRRKPREGRTAQTRSGQNHTEKGAYPIVGIVKACCALFALFGTRQILVLSGCARKASTLHCTGAWVAHGAIIFFARCTFGVPFPLLNLAIGTFDVYSICDFLPLDLFVVGVLVFGMCLGPHKGFLGYFQRRLCITAANDFSYNNEQRSMLPLNRHSPNRCCVTDCATEGKMRVADPNVTLTSAAPPRALPTAANHFFAVYGSFLIFPPSLTSTSDCM